MADYIDTLLSRRDPTYGGAVNETGLVSLQNMFPSENPAPVFLSGLPPSIYPGPQDRLGEDVEGAGTAGILPNVQEMEIQSWFAANPDATAQDIFDVMQANDISPEAVISAMGFDPVSAMATYNTFLQAPAAPTAPTQQADTGVLDTLLGGAKDAVTAVSGVIDTGLQQLGDLIGMGDPSLVVLNPVNPTASVVYGTPTGNATPTIIGSMPNSGAPVGVITGIPALDNILAGVFSQRASQGSRDIKEIIREAVLGTISSETGYPVAGVAGAVEGGLSGDLNKVVDSVSKVVLQIDKKLEDDVNVDPLSIIKGPAQVGEMGPTLEELMTTPISISGPAQVGEMGPTLEELMSETTTTTDTTGGDSTVITGGGDTGGGKTVITGGGKDVADLGTPVTLTPADLGEGPQKAVSSTVETPTTKGVGTTSLLSPSYGQGIRGMKTEKAGIAPLEDTFDISDLSLAEILRLLTAADDNTQRSPYYGGGSVNSANSLDEIIRLLRG